MTSYTLEAERYGEWVTYHFIPINGGKNVETKPSFGAGKTLPVAGARRLYASLLRKGWTRQPEPAINF